MKGANPQQLEHYVKTHSGEGGSGAAASSSKKSVGVPGYVDLTEYITPNQMDALNQQEQNNAKNIFKDDDTYLESDVDEQLIISVPFNQRKSYIVCVWSGQKARIALLTTKYEKTAVKLHSLKFKVPNKTQAPKTIKIYANRTVLGFDDADSIKETQTIELTPENFEEDAVVNLRFVKYQNITHLMLFVVDNQEDEETTQIQQLIFIG